VYLISNIGGKAFLVVGLIENYLFRPPVILSRPRPEEGPFRFGDVGGGGALVLVVVVVVILRFDRRRFPCPASPCPRPRARFNTKLTRGSSVMPE
jgi:hypothetical protein